jgi:hypothetical protein
LPSPGIEEFAKKLIRHVRDAAILSGDRKLDGASRGPVGRRWAHASVSGTPADVARTVLPDCVDDTIFYLLNAIDQGLLKLSYTDESGDLIDLSAAGLGELSGWYMGSDGWRAQYSEQRFADDFGDLGSDGEP